MTFTCILYRHVVYMLPPPHPPRPLSPQPFLNLSRHNLLGPLGMHRLCNKCTPMMNMTLHSSPPRAPSPRPLASPTFDALPHLCYPTFAQPCHVWQAVIFLFEHDDKGTAGFILNRPTEHKLGKIVGADELCPEFADNLLYLGGDVGSDTMHFIHGYFDIQVCEASGKPKSILGFSLQKCHSACLLCAAAASMLLNKCRSRH